MKITSLLGSLLAACLLFTQALFGAPVVTSVSPNFGPTAGGTTVTITGSGFTGVTAVEFGNKTASFTFNSDTSITATSPANNTAGNFHVTVTAGTTSATSNADIFTFQGNWLALVTDSDVNSTDADVTTIDLTTLVQNNFDLGVGPGEQDRLAITPDATTAYIANVGGAQVVVPFNITTFTPLTPITAGGGGGIAITPDGTTAYTINSTNTGLDVIDLATNTVTTSISINLTDSLIEIAITSDGTQAYVTGVATDNVYIVDIVTNTYTGSFLTVSGTPRGIISAPTAADHTVYVAVSSGLGNPDNSLVQPIDTNTNTLGTSIPIASSFLEFLAITADGTQIFVVDNDNEAVVPIDVATQTAGTPISTGGSDLQGIFISPDSKTAYVVDFGTNEIYPIDTATHTQGTRIFLFERESFQISITPDQSPIASFTITPSSSSPGTPVAFNASASLSPTGTIASYAWNFGDGNTLVTTSPTTSHTYATSGTFTVTLTVTNTAGTSTTQTYTGQTVSNQGSPLAQTTRQITIVVPTSPPTNVNGFQCRSKTLTQTDIINVITWSPPTTGNPPVAYEIFRNNLSTLIGTVPAGTVPLEFLDHNRNKQTSYTYFIVSVNAEGDMSAPVTITIPASL